MSPTPTRNSEKPQTAKEKISRLFNCLAAPATRNYTLGEVFQHYAQNKPYESIRDNKLGYTHAGRMVERLHMTAGVITGGLVVAALPLSLTSLALAGGVLCLYKGMGLAGGKLADLAASGRLINRPPQPPAL